VCNVGVFWPSAQTDGASFGMTVTTEDNYSVLDRDPDLPMERETAPGDVALN